MEIDETINLLMNDNRLFIKNNRGKKFQKAKTIKLFANILLYELKNVQSAIFPDNYKYKFEKNSLKVITLESLVEVIGIVEYKIKKGVKKDIVFGVKGFIRPADNLTVSIVEYIIYYYKTNYNINVYITSMSIENNEIILGKDEEKLCVKNGFFLGEAGAGFMRTSFLQNWYPGIKNIEEDSFYSKVDNSKRFKKIIGNGPWDASIALSECSEFLQEASVQQEAIDSICEIIGELAPNAVEHGKANCMIDLCHEQSTNYDNKEKLTNISIVVYNFSDKLLWTDLYEKIFVDNEKITYKKERISTIKEAWKNHQKNFSMLYSKNDFFNLMAFQKISGRKGDRSDGGLGINTLIQNVQEYSVDDYCYVLSGNGALFMYKNLIQLDSKDYIAFNENKNYVGQIPDSEAVQHTQFYFPGVAYNLIFYFEEI